MGGLRSIYNWAFGGDEGRKAYQRKRRDFLKGLAKEKLPAIKAVIEPISVGLSMLVREGIDKLNAATGGVAGEEIAQKVVDLNDKYHDLLYALEEKAGLDFNQDGDIGPPG